MATPAPSPLVKLDFGAVQLFWDAFQAYENFLQAQQPQGPLFFQQPAPGSARVSTRSSGEANIPPPPPPLAVNIPRIQCALRPLIDNPILDMIGFLHLNGTEARAITEDQLRAFFPQFLQNNAPPDPSPDYGAISSICKRPPMSVSLELGLPELKFVISKYFCDLRADFRKHGLRHALDTSVKVQSAWSNALLEGLRPEGLQHRMKQIVEFEQPHLVHNPVNLHTRVLEVA